MRRLPLLLTSARPERTASAEIKRSSETRMPVAQMVCKIRARLSSPFRWAASTNRAYSALDNSRRSSRNKGRWIFSRRTVRACQPIKRRKPLTAALISQNRRQATVLCQGAWMTSRRNNGFFIIPLGGQA